ncbi:MAG: cell division protein FtsL [Gammaproteobacteria bacterium]|nr:MAG: cell division protein FtsL [Gammaproteobacteria bacterium]
MAGARGREGRREGPGAWAPGLLPLLLLGLLATASALAVAYAKHETRRLFVELRGLQQEEEALQVAWGRLVLEEATWGTHGRVERLARRRLGMVAPAPGQVVVIRP